MLEVNNRFTDAADLDFGGTMKSDKKPMLINPAPDVECNLGHHNQNELPDIQSEMFGSV